VQEGDTLQGMPYSSPGRKFEELSFRGRKATADWTCKGRITPLGSSSDGARKNCAPSIPPPEKKGIRENPFRTRKNGAHTAVERKKKVAEPIVGLSTPTPDKETASHSSSKGTGKKGSCCRVQKENPSQRKGVDGGRKNRVPNARNGLKMSK